ncbi:MAG: ATP-binding protein [Chloroflexi bacterium]|nr:ATP-binding protein [Chloroflexota bacterium]
MTVPMIFDTCRPRQDVLEGTVTEADFAADLAQVIVGEGSADYLDPARFFANTYPTRGLKNLLANVCGRLSGAGGEVASIFRLDTSYGGGKSHGLIALCHAARSGVDVPGIEEFVDPPLLPQKGVRIAAFDGENADPANGRRMEAGHLAFTPWGEIASALGGRDGYERVRKSDEDRVAPGAETLRELFGGEPTLILLDELSVYLRKVGNAGNARAQLTAFLTSLFKAVEGAPNAVLVYTLAIGRDGRAIDAYSDEHQFIADQMAEVDSISARKATLLNPTEEDETVQVLRRRLFESIDESAAAIVAESYRTQWASHHDDLPDVATRPGTGEVFRSGYPLHPEVLDTLTGKTATLGNFQRVRGMLRLLARTISHLWQEKPADATAVHLHHLDPGHEPIRQEMVTRLAQSAYAPAISNDVSAGSGEKKALAEKIDAAHHSGLAPYASYVARTIFMHTLAFNDRLKGISPEQLRYSVLGPAMDISFIEDARKRFIADSAYLDDRPGAPMRFLAEANLRQIIRRTEDHVDAGEARAELNDRIRQIFDGRTLEAVPFPGGPFDVPDEVADGRPKLVVLGYEAVTIGGSVENVSELIERIYRSKGSEGSALRALRNNVIFVVADDARSEDMRRKVYRRLALAEMKKPERLVDLAEHQQAQVREMEARSEQELAIAVQQCYRHVFYPSRNRVGASDIDLAHSAIDTHSTSDRPGAGQQQVVRTLRDLNKLRLSEDEPDSPAYVRDRTPLKKGQISTLSLRDEFRRDPALPILVGDDIFVRGVRRGIDQGEYVYQRGELLYGQGDPAAGIEIDEQSVIFTMGYAKNVGLWPRKPEAPPEQPPEDTTGGGGKPADDGTVPSPDGSGSDKGVPDSFTAEGVLREALVRLWEQARAKKAASIAVLTIRMFEAGDAFRLLGAIGAVSGAERIVTITGGYETRDGGSFELEFRGPVSDAQPVREFLEPQLRDASSRNLEAGFELTFESGLPMDGDTAEKLTDRLSRFASGAAYVSATAKVKA